MSDAPLSIDPEALLRESTWLHGLARSLVHDEHEAEDIVQSTFLTAVTRPPRSAVVLPAWLGRVARRMAIRAGRKKRSRVRREHVAARPEAIPAAVDVVARTSLFRQLTGFVLELAEPYRTTVLLRYFDDVPVRDIASRQAVPVATVKTRLRRALGQLRERLDGAAGGSDDWRSALAVPAGAIIMATKAKVGVAAAVILIAGAIGWRTLSPSIDAPSDQTPIARRETPVPPAATEPPAQSAAPIVPKRLEEVAPASSPASRAGTVTGLIVDDKSGEPVAGAEVSAFVNLEDERPESTATTGADGRFQIESSRHPGVILARLLVLSSRHVRWCGDNRVFPNGKNQISGNDIGTIRLIRGAAVSGRVLTAGSRQPVAGAHLFLYGYRGDYATPLFRIADPAGVSAADGTFTTTTRLPPSRGAAAQVLALHDGGLDWAQVAVLKEIDEIRDVEILARPGYPLRVRVTDESGKPIEGATVMVAPRFSPLGAAYPAVDWLREPKWIRREGPLSLLSTRFVHKSDAEGAAGFEGLPEPTLDPTERYPTATTDVFAFKTGFDPGRVRLEKPASGRPVGVVLKVRRPFVVSGSVRRSDQSPVAGAEVTLVVNMLPQPAVVTDEKGEYRITADVAPNGAATLAAAAQGLSRAVHPIKLDSDKDVQHDFKLLPALSISGRVIDEDGAPVPGTVQVSGQLSERSLSGKHVEGSNFDQIQPDGSFELEGADSGEWRLSVTLGKEWEPPRERMVHGGDRVEIVVARRVVGVARLDAEIVDATTGTSVDPLSASLYSRSTFAGERSYPPQPTVSPGHVRAEGLPPGAWRLYVHTALAGRVRREFTVGPDDRDVRLRIEVGKPAVIIARVVLDDLPAPLRPRSIGLSSRTTKTRTECGSTSPGNLCGGRIPESPTPRIAGPRGVSWCPRVFRSGSASPTSRSSTRRP